jgi:hypothetical protein
VGLQLKARATTGCPLDHPGETSRREGRAALADEDKRRRRTLALEASQRAKLIALQGMGARNAILDPTHVKHSAIEVHLVPTQVARLGRSQPMSEGDQDHGSVPMALTVRLGGFDQAVDLAWREVLAGAKLGIRSPCRRNCSENLSWCVQLDR